MRHKGTSVAGTNRERDLLPAGVERQKKSSGALHIPPKHFPSHQDPSHARVAGFSFTLTDQGRRRLILRGELRLHSDC
jgi:hypothetical protein